jgi:hypothetical protein
MGLRAKRSNVFSVALGGFNLGDLCENTCFATCRNDAATFTPICCTGLTTPSARFASLINTEFNSTIAAVANLAQTAAGLPDADSGGKLTATTETRGSRQ